ncbi:hypothetical protein [Sphingobium sp. MK2]|uniref:hypothetical protein n=1 Tax=Sphingobium sp. MK2 TaxID=3116540 RepID=UPI0032E358F9
MKSIEPLSGWMLDQIVRLDEVRPGLAGQMLRASAERRQVVSAFLAVTDYASEAPTDTAAFLAGADHRSILDRAFGRVPDGLRGALRRSGPQPHDPKYYHGLFKHLVESPRHVTTAIARSEKLDHERLAVIEALPADLCDIRIVSRIDNRKQATDVVLAIDLMERRGLCRKTVIEGLLRSSRPVSQAVRRWSLHMAFPPGPIPKCDGFRPIASGIELRRVAKRYQNCGRNYLMPVQCGNHAFGEFSHDGREVLISFDRANGMWIVDGVYGFRNRDVHPDISAAAYAFAARHGVPAHEIRNRGDQGVEALRRLALRFVDWNS